MEWNLKTGEHQRFSFDVHVRYPFAVSIAVDGKHSLRVPDVGLQYVADCEAFRALPKNRGWEMRCEVEDASVFINPVVQDQGKAPDIVNKLEATFEQARINFRLFRDGHISSVNTTGNARSSDDADRMEFWGNVAEKGILALDIPLQAPEGSGSAIWYHKPYLFSAMPIGEPPPGKVKATVELGQRHENYQMLHGKATGGVMMQNNHSWEIQVTSTSAFDVEKGILVRSEHVLVGGANSNAISSINAPYMIEAKVDALNADTVVKLRPSEGR